MISTSGKYDTQYLMCVNDENSQKELCYLFFPKDLLLYMDRSLGIEFPTAAIEWLMLSV